MSSILSLMEDHERGATNETWRKWAPKTNTLLWQMSCPEEVGELMKTIVSILAEPRQPTTTVNIKKLFNRIPRKYSGLVSDWCDEDKLNILHHSIIYNSPEIVEFLLTETTYFPGTRMPMTNPYAHLAAVLGHTECLRQVLLHRPNDFFQSQTPNHVIVLPDYIKRRLKFDENLVAFSKSKDSLLSKIKQTTQIAEHAMQAFSHDNDENIPWGEELNAMNTMRKKGSGRTTRLKAQKAEGTLPVVNASEEKAPWATVALKKLHTSGHTGKSSKDEQQPQDRGLQKEPEKINAVHFQRKIKPYSSEHLITVYRKVLFDPDHGVVSGVGNPVNVTFGEDVTTHLTSNGTKTPTQTSGWCSRKSRQLRSSHDKHRKDTGSQASTPVTMKNQQPRRLTPLRNMSKRKISVNEKVELGIRGKKKYKDFHLKLDYRPTMVKDDSYKYKDKTPLALASERGFIDCVRAILEIIVLKNSSLVVSEQALTLATKARSPEAIVVLLDRPISYADYQCAVMEAIHKMYPDCLAALVSNRAKERKKLFEGTNLYHVLYSQTLMAKSRYEMMPEMTRVLIQNKEDVNGNNVPRTFPMYTLISCAFNVMRGRQVVFYAECLKLLLQANANPHFNEDTLETASKVKSNLSFTRRPFYSAISCILESAKSSKKFFEHKYWPKLFSKNFIMTVEMYDRTRRRILNDILLDYMDSVCELGLDRTVIRSLLRYGGNPDFKEDGNYPINLYFDNLFPYLTRFEVIDSYTKYQTELQDLMIMCRFMTRKCIVDAKTIFLRKHLLSASVQGLPISRYFCYLINETLKSPQSLQQLAALNIWLQVKRNVKRARLIPVSCELLSVIIP